MPENENHSHTRRLCFKTKNKVKGLLMTYRSKSKSPCLIMFPAFSMNPLTLNTFEGCFYTRLSKHRQGKHSCSLPLTFNQDPSLPSWPPWQQGDRPSSYSAHFTFHRIHQDAAETRREQSEQSISEAHPRPASAKAIAQLQEVSSTGRLIYTQVIRDPNPKMARAGPSLHPRLREPPCTLHPPSVVTGALY